MKPHQHNMITIDHHYPFSQLYILSDLKMGGNCFAYMALYLTYLNIHRLQPQTTCIDYPRLIQHFKQLDAQQKQSLQNIQHHFQYATEDHLINYKAIFDADLAVFNHNVSMGPTHYLQECVQIIRDDLSAQNTGVFYSISVDDAQQTFAQQCLSHVVGLYVAPNQCLHFFDANSGFYLLKVPEAVSSEHFTQLLLDLIFKKNALFKWFFNASAPTLQFEMVRSAPLSQLSYQHRTLAAQLSHTLQSASVMTKTDATAVLTQTEKAMINRHQQLWQQMREPPQGEARPSTGAEGVLARLHRIGHS